MVNCGCGIPVARRTSWTHENPGRKFIACKFYNHETEQRGCNTFEWVDEEILDWQGDITNILIAEKHRHATDNHILTMKLNSVAHEKCRLAEEVQILMKKLVRIPKTSTVVVKEQARISIVGVCIVVVSVVVSFIFVKLFG
ncbi:uncharacterized protein At4g04775-like [Beta vulgaris subsp. vulgaris]|uniref:uncharacterized protein At4g04775-like n=1 Tax=Beta vulgaris subsp. vulgaris TaxID=3555 RepID=UPI0005401700|nr:uncharacterized protein At4g04775-like [Beta vulgaris subsp. vulgaris]